MSWRDDIHTAKIAGATFIGLFTLVWVTWQFAASNYEAQIESLKTALIETRSTYEVLSRKAEGLFEPQLWKVDTVRFDMSSLNRDNMAGTMFLQGGRVRFEIRWAVGKRRIRVRYTNDISGVWAIDTTSEGGKESRLLLNSVDLTLSLDKDKFEFSISDQRYYLSVSMPNPDSKLAVISVFRLNPLYKPVTDTGQTTMH